MIRLSTGSQCSSLRIGVARAYPSLHKTRRAAQIWTACSRRIRYFGRNTQGKACKKEKRTLSISKIETVDKKANHEFPDKIVFSFEEKVVLHIIKAFIGSILKY